jgi:drug/metabolite transporter (DMT)-like permease
VGVALAGIVLGEALGPIQVVGGALVLVGALVLQVRSDPNLEATLETAAGPVM